MLISCFLILYCLLNIMATPSVSITVLDDAQTHFANVLLIIIINGPAPSKVHVCNYYALWSKFFQHHAFFAHWSAEEIKTVKNYPCFRSKPNSTTLLQFLPATEFDFYRKRPKVPTGNFAYRSMLVAMELFPQTF